MHHWGFNFSFIGKLLMHLVGVNHYNKRRKYQLSGSSLVTKNKLFSEWEHLLGVTNIKYHIFFIFIFTYKKL